jgi:hypothetical protein
MAMVVLIAGVEVAPTTFVQAGFALAEPSDRTMPRRMNLMDFTLPL